MWIGRSIQVHNFLPGSIRMLPREQLNLVAAANAITAWGLLGAASLL